MSFLESRETLAPDGIGKSVRRREDVRLLTGGGHYADDFSLPDQVYAHILRSPHAHATITGIDATAALALPGVLAVLTGADAAADGVGPIPHNPVPANPPEAHAKSPDPSPFCLARHPALAPGGVRSRNKAIAVGVTETP